MKAGDVFAEMPQAFDADKAGDLRATFGFDLSGDEGGTWVVSIADGTCNVEETSVQDADVKISMDAGDFVKMVNGELQPLIAFTQGKIKLTGDMNLAMKVQELFAN